MKTLSQFLKIVPFVIFLLPFSVRAGEMIAATCVEPDSKNETVVYFDTSGGKQVIAGVGESDVKFMKSRIIVENEMVQITFNLKNGKVYVNGEHEGTICKYDNLAALEKKTTPSASSNVQEGEVIKLLKSMKSQLDRIEKSLPK